MLERLLKVARSKVPVGLAINTESGEGEKKVFGRLSIALNYQRTDNCHRERDLISRPNFRKFKENFVICLHSLVKINSLKDLPFFSGDDEPALLTNVSRLTVPNHS